jgi:hypothetical protein
MNIFISDIDYTIAARNLDDRRLVKMVLETAQLLCSALHLNNADVSIPYKLTHKNHPCTKWAAESEGNFNWLAYHGMALAEEYEYRYGRRHKCRDIIFFAFCFSHCLPEKPLQPFPNCTVNKVKGISFKHVENTVDAYKLYLSARWDTDSKLPKWTKRTKPEWYNGRV